MGLRTKEDISNFIDNSNNFNELVIECRNRYLKSQGKKQHSNFSGSGNACDIIRLLFSQLIASEKNEFTFPINELNTFLNISSKHTSTRMTSYFKEYGIGDFVSTGKSRYNIFKLVDASGKEIENKIRRESHYTFYFSKTFIELLRERDIGSDFLDYDRLIKEADKSAELLEQIANTKTTSVYIQQYISEHLSIDTYIEIEKDFLNKEGFYSKKSNTIVTDNNGSVSIVCTENVSNTFIPREKVNEEEIKEEVDDILGDFFEEKEEKVGFRPGNGPKRNSKQGLYGSGRAHNSK